MTKCYFSDRLEEIDGELCRIVDATAVKDSSKCMDIYREFEGGRCECRNLYYCYCGYYVGFPGDVVSLYHSGDYGYLQKLDDYGKCNRITCFSSRLGTEQEKSLILGKYPDFKYILRKFPMSIARTLDVLRVWKEHKEIELVLATGFEKVALNKSFWKLSEQKRKRICLFMRKNRDCKNYSLLDIQTVLKRNLSKIEFDAYKDFCFRVRRVGFDTWKYLVKIKKADWSGVHLYTDYLDMLNETSHNAKDEYWKYPKDLQRKHDEIREEIRLEKELREKEEAMKKQEAYFSAVKKLVSLRKEIGGYCVYVPETVEDISFQAKELHQCLIYADYVSKVAQKKCVLVFIRKGNEPVATVELLKGDKIGQFYANELDRSNCLPTDEVRGVFNKWLEYKKSRKAA